MLRPSPNHGTQRLPNESESESESEFNLPEPHIQKKYLNMISGYKMWIGRHLLIPVWSLSQGPPDDDDETTMNRGAIFNNSNNINSYRGLIHC